MFRSEPTIIKTHKKGKRSAFKKFQDSLCVQKKKQKEEKTCEMVGEGIWSGCFSC